MENVIEISFNLIKLVEKKNITGAEKKLEFLKALSNTLGEEEFIKYEPYIDYVLETVIFLSKTHLISGINKDSFRCCLK